MKKVIICMIVLFVILFCLTACSTVRHTGDMKDINTYETHIYCNSQGYLPCINCERWTSELDISIAYRVEAVEVSHSDTTSLGSHTHYIITWINKED